jgi:hypothetical protein
LSKIERYVLRSLQYIFYVFGEVPPRGGTSLKFYKNSEIPSSWLYTIIVYGILPGTYIQMNHP